jgi:YVTN family beta-propeller protein
MFMRGRTIICFLGFLFSASANPQTQSPVPPVREAIRGPEITKIAVGFGPQGIAFTPGAVWVAYGNDKEFGVARIDAVTNQVVARVQTGRWPVGASAGEDSVWIVNRDDNTVTRIDPESNRIIATIRVGKKPIGVDVAGGSIWVTNSGGGSVSRIDPKTNSVTATIHVGSEPFGISVNNGLAWVVNAGGPLSHSGSLACIDTKSNVLTKKIKVPWSNIVLAVNNDVWVGTLDGHVIRVDAQSGSVLSQLFPGGALSGLAASKDVLWAANNANGTLWKIDLQANNVVDKVDVGKSPIIFGRGVDSDGAIWVSNVGDGTVMKFKP